MGTRYVGLKLENTFGSEDIATEGIIYSEFSESSLDVANDTALEYKKGLGRGTRQIDQVVYVPQGDVTSAVTASLFPYIAYGIGGKYEYADGKHYFWNTDGRIAPSYQVHVGKDILEHVFVGATISSLAISCDKEYAEATASMVCKKDLVNGEAKGEAYIAENCLNEVAIPFSQVTIKIDGEDYTTDRVLNSLSLSIENNASAVDGVGLGDIYTKQIQLGEANATVDFENLFTDDTFLTMFKAGGTHSLEVKFTDKNDNYISIAYPALYLTKSEQVASGRDIMKQPLSFKAMAGTIQAGTQTLNTDFLITVSNGEEKYTF